MSSSASALTYKTCDICKQTTNTDFDTLLFGVWQESKGVCVHYFCLLLSSHLPQQGKDASGINGFLMRDIRHEIAAASKRICCFCNKPHASIACHKCQEYFHLVCGKNNSCLFQFRDEFRSFCNDCVPEDELLPPKFHKPPSTTRCSICKEQLGKFKLMKVIFGACCGRGYAHSLCLQKYAMCAGYYLRCLWCRSTAFRDDVRQRGIFVPDRDAQWEREKDAFRDLHRGHSRCDMEPCLCARGRDFVSSKWVLSVCSLCGSFGAHNPMCITGNEKSKTLVTDFRCHLCANVETKVGSNESPQKTATPGFEGSQIDSSVYMIKKGTNPFPSAAQNIDETPTFSGGDSDTLSNDLMNNTIRPSGKTVEDEDQEMPLISVNETVQEIEHYLKSVESSKPSDNAAQTVEDLVADLELSQDSNLVSSVMLTQDNELANETDIQYAAISSTSQDAFATFDVFEFDADTREFLGVCKVRIDLSEPRFEGKTVETIQKMPDLLSEKDVIERRSSDLGIFAEINRIIEENR